MVFNCNNACGVGKHRRAVVLSGYADVRMAVRLMEDGALTLLESPTDPRS